MTRRDVRRLLTVLLGSVGLGGVVGGAALLADPEGAALGLTTAPLSGGPFEDYRVPGLVLLVVNGIGSLLGATALHRRYGPPLALALGSFLVLWMVVQLTIVGLTAWIQALFVVVGLAEARLAIALRGSRGGRGVARWTAVVVCALVGLTAVGGGLELVLYPEGSPWMTVPVEILQPTPFRSFFVPGLLLGGVVGGVHVVATVWLARDRRGAGVAASAAGITIVTWILAEMALLGTHDAIEAAYVLAGALTLGAAGWLEDPAYPKS